MHFFVAGVPSTDLGIMMHHVFPQFSMNVEGNVRRSSFVKTCQFHHGKQNTTLFGLCIQYNSKHDFYIYIYIHTLCTFIYFYAFPLQLFYHILSWFLFLPLHASRYGPCGSDQLVVTERHKLVTNSAASSGTVRPLRTWQCLLKITEVEATRILTLARPGSPIAKASRM